METLITSVAEKNVQLVKRGYEAFNTADMKTLGELFHKNVVWTTPGRSSIGGKWNGRDATFAQFGRYGAETHGTFKANLKSLTANEDGTVVGIHQNTGTRNGKKLDIDCCIVFELKDGQLIAGKEYFFDSQAWDEFWS